MSIIFYDTVIKMLKIDNGRGVIISITTPSTATKTLESEPQNGFVRLSESNDIVLSDNTKAFLQEFGVWAAGKTHEREFLEREVRMAVHCMIEGMIDFYCCKFPEKAIEMADKHNVLYFVPKYWRNDYDNVKE